MKDHIHKALVALAAIITSILVFPVIASAHSNHIRVVVRAGCTLGVNLEAHDYPDTPAGASASVTVEYDGQVTFQQLFGPNIKTSAPNPDQTKPHVVIVTFDRFDYTGPDGDKVYPPIEIAACDVPQGVTTTTIPAPTTTIATPACVLGPDGHWNFAGTDIPCEGFTPTTTTTMIVATDTPPVPSTTTTVTQLIPPVTPTPPSSLPSTGAPSKPAIGIAMVLFGCGWGLLRLARRPRRQS